MKPVLRAMSISLLVLLLAILSVPLGSMNSLRKVADYPLLEMDVYGEPFMIPRNAAEVRRMLEWFYPDAIERPRDIACSLAAARDGDHMVYGRNFDWYQTVPILFRVHPLQDRYGSVSLVDGSYLGVRGNGSWLDRFNAAGGYIAPFDGMNDQGLFIGIAMIGSFELPIDPEKETLTGVQLVRRILDECATVEEAIELINRFNVDFFPGPHLHFLIADRTGKSRVIEFTAAGVHVVNWDNYGCLTNFVMDEAERDSWQGRCNRFDALMAAGTENESMNSDQMMDLLSRVKQELKQGRTEWSAVYRTDGTVIICLGMDYSRSYRFHINSTTGDVR